MSTSTVGVVIGRFQVPDLHAGHRHLISTAQRENQQLLILIGSGRGLPTARNPLPFSLRRQMILDVYPTAQVVELFDQPTDQAWGQQLDQIVEALFPHYTPTLYGSRDSFIPHYCGQLKTCVVEPIKAPSGSDLRAKLRNSPRHTTDFRRGVIYSQANRLPTPYQAVDIAIIGGDRERLLLGQKPTDGDRWRFVGGFVDAKLDQSLEAAAKREASEETGQIGLDHFTYVGSTSISDWRYRGDEDRVMTALFSAQFIFGRPEASDDLSDLRWFRWDEVAAVLHDNHQPLFNLLNQVK